MMETEGAQTEFQFQEFSIKQSCRIFLIVLLMTTATVLFIAVRSSDVNTRHTPQNLPRPLENGEQELTHSFAEWWHTQYKELYKAKVDLEDKNLDPDLFSASYIITDTSKSSRYFDYIIRCPFVLSDHALPERLTIRKLFGLPSKQFLEAAVQIHARLLIQEIQGDYWGGLSSKEIDGDDDDTKEDASDDDLTKADDASAENDEDGKKCSNEDEGQLGTNSDVKGGSGESKDRQGEVDDAPQDAVANSDEDEYEEDSEIVPLPSFVMMTAKVSALAARVRCEHMKMRLVSIEDQIVADNLSFMLEDTMGEFWTSGIRNETSVYKWETGEVVHEKFWSVQGDDGSKTGKYAIACLSLSLVGCSHKLVPTACTRRQGYICQEL